jgi:hypothetical protein
MLMNVRPLPLSLAALLLLFVLAACSVPPLRDPNLLQDTSLLDDEPCAAPCWRGITPGESAWSDALTILEDDASLESVDRQSDEDSAAEYAVWQGRGGTAQCCQMISLDGETVDVVFIRLAPDITVSDVIDAKGEPTYAVSTEYSGDQSIVNLIYPDSSLILYAFVAGPEAALLDSSEIIAAVYVSQDDMELLLLTSDLHEWDGYQPFSEYGLEAPLEVTPSITLTPAGTPAESTPETTPETGS